MVKYIERSNRGHFSCCLIARSRAKTVGNLAGMRSYIVGYLDLRTGLRTFVVHFFADPDGSIGASGLLDPKWIYEDGVIFTSNRRRDLAGAT